MPTYTFKNETTGETEEHFLSISEYDRFKVEHPHLTRHFSELPPTVAGISAKPDGGFREALQRIKAANRGSDINTF